MGWERIKSSKDRWDTRFPSGTSLPSSGGENRSVQKSHGNIIASVLGTEGQFPSYFFSPKVKDFMGIIPFKEGGRKSGFLVCDEL